MGECGTLGVRVEGAAGTGPSLRLLADLGSGAAHNNSSALVGAVGRDNHSCLHQLGTCPAFTHGPPTVPSSHSPPATYRPGPYLDDPKVRKQFSEAYRVMTDGFLAFPLKFPGTAVWRSMQVGAGGAGRGVGHCGIGCVGEGEWRWGCWVLRGGVQWAWGWMACTCGTCVGPLYC